VIDCLPPDVELRAVELQEDVILHWKKTPIVVRTVNLATTYWACDAQLLQAVCSPNHVYVTKLVEFEQRVGGGIIEPAATLEGSEYGMHASIEIWREMLGHVRKAQHDRRDDRDLRVSAATWNRKFRSTFAAELGRRLQYVHLAA
jgi:hypothetical protein